MNKYLEKIQKKSKFLFIVTFCSIFILMIEFAGAIGFSLQSEKVFLSSFPLEFIEYQKKYFIGTVIGFVMIIFLGIYISIQELKKLEKINRI